jgi:hypothetical protein
MVEKWLIYRFFLKYVKENNENIGEEIISKLTELNEILDKRLLKGVENGNDWPCKSGSA